VEPFREEGIVAGVEREDHGGQEAQEEKKQDKWGTEQQVRRKM
jgi:hypothetical protein